MKQINTLYQQYLPTNAVRSPVEAKPWGLKEFFIRDPSGNLILFAERMAQPWLPTAMMLCQEPPAQLTSRE
ncbi:MAG: VOC family protein [Ktedonobacteraceae bacterium]